MGHFRYVFKVFFPLNAFPGGTDFGYDGLKAAVFYEVKDSLCGVLHDSCFGSEKEEGGMGKLISRLGHAVKTPRVYFFIYNLLSVYMAAHQYHVHGCLIAIKRFGD